MTESDLLDALIAAIIVLVALIGFWQGALRTLLFVAAALLGSELALWWSDNLGDHLADLLPLELATGAFVASVVFILATLLLVGGGFGTLARGYPLDWRSRVAGMVVGLALALLTVSLVIRYFFIHMQQRATDALADTRLASFLWERSDWVVLGTVGAVLAMLVIGWVLGPAGESAVSSADSPAAHTRASDAPRQGGRAARFDVGDSGSQGDRDGIPQTPLVDRELSPLADSQIFAPATSNLDTDRDGASSPSAEPEGISPTEQRLMDDIAFAPFVAAATDTVTFAAEGPADRRESSGVCPNCGMLLRRGDGFCPDCGFPVSP
jgi:uncharacterized membrane protein required for colicin V production